MRRALVLSLLFACGSRSSDAPPTARTGAEPDKLWALAPPGAEGGFVVTAHGVAELAKAFVRVRGEIATYPEFALAKGQLAALSKIGLDGDKLPADIGLATDRGFAVFALKRDSLTILPVGDRGKFVAAMHGTTTGDTDAILGATCKQLAQGYACAKDPALFDQLGKGSLVGKVAAGARGDAELWMSKLAIGGGGVDAVSIAAAIDDGIVDLDVFVQSKMFERFASDAALPPDPRGGGFAVANFAPAKLAAPPGPQGDLLRAIKGPIEATMSSSGLGFLARVPLADATKLQAVVEHCEVMGTALGVDAKSTSGVCHVTVPALVALSFDVWIEDGELRVAQAKGAFDPGAGSERTAVGKELAAYPNAIWGRGSLYAMDLPKRLPPQAMEKLPELPAVLRAFGQISEVGAGAKLGADGVHGRLYVRTIWANPDDVAATIGRISASEALSGKGDELAATLAKGETPFARDLAAGPGGLVMPTTIMGILGAVAVPAFMDYMKKSKKTEAALQLNKLGKNAKTFYITNAQFPKGMASLTPSAPCCGQPNNKCGVAAWTADVWQALDFQIDEPTLFQYSYASDGDTFNATAVGDLDCDGTFVTYTLSGTAENGNPHVLLTEPPPNSD